MFSGDIVLIANSPGELSALVRPVAKKFKDKAPESRIILFITPCQYSSGSEAEYAKNNIKLDYIVSAKDYQKWLLGAPLPENFTPKAKGIVLFLGGDLLHATLIAKKLGYKAYAYLAGKNVSWANAFSRFFVPNKDIFINRIDGKKMLEVGDLMTEPYETLSRDDARSKWRIEPGRRTIAMMPGSRLWEIKHLLPIYAKIGKALKKSDPKIELMLIISPFTSIAQVETFHDHSTFDVFAPFESIKAADLVITIPGTNTAQIASLGLPMIVIFPLDKPDAIPLEGLAHYITSIPLLGPAIKRIAADIINKNTKYFALPNIKADAAVVPEIRGRIDTDKTAKLALKMLDDKELMDKTSQFLSYIMKPKNTSGMIVEAILNEPVL